MASIATQRRGYARRPGWVCLYRSEWPQRDRRCPPSRRNQG